ncbi:MAG: hypothetical protein ACOYMB_01510 [Patescibacteria group bacterium]
MDINDLEVKAPELLTITDIYNPSKQRCLTHFNVWYFINVDRNSFNPNSDNLAEEFLSVEWMDIEKARQLVTDKSTLEAIGFVEKNYFKN